MSMSKLLTRVYEMYVPVAEDHGQILTCNISLDAYVRGDAELLTQMVINLIENALRHTPAGTKVSLGLEVAHELATIIVTDSGMGIPADERQKVFRRFYRVSASRTTPGNGLGLALVQAIANLHEATLTVSDNAPGLKVCIAFSKNAGGDSLAS
jgi:signal transduction histidine kinase